MEQSRFNNSLQSLNSCRISVLLYKNKTVHFQGCFFATQDRSMDRSAAIAAYIVCVCGVKTRPIATAERDTIHGATESSIHKSQAQAIQRWLFTPMWRRVYSGVSFCGCGWLRNQGSSSSSGNSARHSALLND